MGIEKPLNDGETDWAGVFRLVNMAGYELVQENMDWALIMRYERMKHK